MRKLLKKIPLIVWAVALSILAFVTVEQDFFSDLNTEQIRLLAGFFTLIGLIFVSIQIQGQWKNERIKTEYLNQPDFEFKGFGLNAFSGSGPVLCPNPTQCNDDHWFNLHQTGNLAAKNLKISLFHKEESTTNIDITKRWLGQGRLGKGNTFQYKLPQFEIPFKYFNPNINNCFIALLEYKSEYSQIKYKRVYQLCAMPLATPTSSIANDWKGKIQFYEETLILTNDSESVTVKEILKNRWLKFLKALRIRKDNSYQDWILDI